MAMKRYTYNQLGYLATAVNGRSQASSYVYDDAGRLISKTDPDGTITYSYDANGNLLTITEGAGTGYNGGYNGTFILRLQRLQRDVHIATVTTGLQRDVHIVTHQNLRT